MITNDPLGFSKPANPFDIVQLIMQPAGASRRVEPEGGNGIVSRDGGHVMQPFPVQPTNRFEFVIEALPEVKPWEVSIDATQTVNVAPGKVFGVYNSGTNEIRLAAIPLSYPGEEGVGAGAGWVYAVVTTAGGGSAVYNYSSAFASTDNLSAFVQTFTALRVEFTTTAPNLLDSVEISSNELWIPVAQVEDDGAGNLVATQFLFDNPVITLDWSQVS